MNIFVLCTGRTASTTLANACQYISNYSCAHESRFKEIGSNRLDFPDHHIEIDNRLSYCLGSLDKKYGDNAFYVFLKRNEIETANSFNKRWHIHNHSIIFGFAQYIKGLEVNNLDNNSLFNIAQEYVQTTNYNIDLFLKDKTKKCIINIENFEQDFLQFYKLINAEGELKLALQELKKKSNISIVNEPIKQTKQHSSFIINKISHLLPSCFIKKFIKKRR